jgi:hypothetical protein
MHAEPILIKVRLPAMRIRDVAPRLEGRDEKLNAKFVPLDDPSSRLFLASDDPVPMDQNGMVQQQIDMKYGVVAVNEVRSERGLPPASGGDMPWLPLNWDGTDAPRAAEEPGTGWNRKPKTRRV